MFIAHVYNAWGKKIDVQRLDSPRTVILEPFETWAYVIFKSETSGVIAEVFVR